MQIARTDIHTKDSPLTLRDAALELVWPTRCAGCEKRGALLCECCDDALLNIQRRYACPRCGAPFGHLVCTECYSQEGKESYNYAAAVSVVEMDELSGRIVVLYKDNNEHRLASIMAHKLAQQLPLSWIPWADALTWIPADKKALRRRGFDHMQKIAEELSKLIQIPAQSYLIKKTGKDQRGLNRKERFQNLEELIEVKPITNPLSQNILLIDDVHTTGATFDVASLRLLEAGAKEVRVASFARVW